MDKKITLKQRKWIKNYIKTGNATESAMRVYDCKNRQVAESIGSENLRKLAISDLMEDMGLTDVALINVGAEGLLAKKTDIQQINRLLKNHTGSLAVIYNASMLIR